MRNGLLSRKQHDVVLITSFILFISAVLVLLLTPQWLKKASLSEYKIWFPTIGDLMYIYINVVVYIQIFCSFIVILWYVFKRLRSNAISKALVKNIKLDFFTLKTLALGSVLENRNFTAHLFFRLLCLSYLVALSSLLWQFALVSENGLIPYKEFASVTLQKDGWPSIFTYPSIFWICQSNWFIKSILIVSILIALLGFLGRFKVLSFFILWLVYLSIVTFGRDLFLFPWDSFLLEIGFISIIASFFILKLKQLPRIVLFAFFILFFRQWLSMGLTKVLYSDGSWSDLTYMKFFWLNQPSPTPVAWYFYQLPMPIQKIFTAITLIGELLIPLLLFFGRRGRIVSFFMSLLFSIIIELNGNYGFFNLITVVLGLWCLDDTFLRKERQQSIDSLKTRFNYRSILLLVLLPVIIVFNSFYIIHLFIPQKYHANFINYHLLIDNKYAKIHPLYYFYKTGEVFSRFRLVSPHGVFKSIPKERIKMEIQVKVKGRGWQVLSPKVGEDVCDFHFAAPFMNRIPFLFYYEAYGVGFRSLPNPAFPRIDKLNPNTYYFDSWLEKIVDGVFEENEEVLKIMSYAHHGEVEEVRVLGWLMKIQNTSNRPFSKEDSNNELLFKFRLKKNQEFPTPFYNAKEVLDKL